MWIQIRFLPASGTPLSVSVISWIGRPCTELPIVATLRTRGWLATDCSQPSLRVTVYGKYLASRRRGTPGGVTSVKRCVVDPTSVGTALVGTRL